MIIKLMIALPILIVILTFILIKVELHNENILNKD